MTREGQVNVELIWEDLPGTSERARPKALLEIVRAGAAEHPGKWARLPNQYETIKKARAAQADYQRRYKEFEFVARRLAKDGEDAAVWVRPRG
jgi:hypothetical protein